jgi:hypothetical protein
VTKTHCHSDFLMDAVLLARQRGGRNTGATKLAAAMPQREQASEGLENQIEKGVNP